MKYMFEYLETDRLEIVPLTPELLKLLIGDLKSLEIELSCSYKAEPIEGIFGDIVAGQLSVVEKDPENYMWYTFWLFIRKSDRIVVGSADFKDRPDADGLVEIGYGLGKEYEHRGYMTEAVKAMCSWALKTGKVRQIVAETENDNLPSQQVLKRCGFVEYKRDETCWWKYLNEDVREKMHYDIKRLVDFPKLKFKMAGWFHEKWGIPKALYEENMDQCLEGKEPYPQWYAVMDGDTIIGGLGVIENDFHDRKNLKPNVCAVYVEKDYRNRGIAKAMLNFVCEDMKERGIEPLYLLTDHTSFYEKCGWEFLCFAQGDHDNHQSRMYIHKA